MWTLGRGESRLPQVRLASTSHHFRSYAVTFGIWMSQKSIPDAGPTEIWKPTAGPTYGAWHSGWRIHEARRARTYRRHKKPMPDTESYLNTLDVLQWRKETERHKVQNFCNKWNHLCGPQVGLQLVDSKPQSYQEWPSWRDQWLTAESPPPSCHRDTGMRILPTFKDGQWPHHHLCGRRGAW